MENCIGCLNHTLFLNQLYLSGNSCIFLSPPYRDMVEINKCPCNTCIIKVMCRTRCEDRYRFYLENSPELPITIKRGLYEE
jgi:hypothetical protein